MGLLAQRAENRHCRRDHEDLNERRCDTRQHELEKKERQLFGPFRRVLRRLATECTDQWRAPEQGDRDHGKPGFDTRLMVERGIRGDAS